MAKRAQLLAWLIGSSALASRLPNGWASWLSDPVSNEIPSIPPKLLLLGALLGGCASLPQGYSGVDAPSFRKPQGESIGVALVLSGGAARGFAHVGVLKVLEANGLKPDLVVGCSAGSIVGALYASGRVATEVEAALETLDLSTFGDLAVPGLGFLQSSLGLVSGERLHQFVNRHAAGHRMEDFPIRFAAMATDLETGEAIAFNAGDVGFAVRASSAVPGLITPARIGARMYSECAMSSPLPIAAARRLGASKVIAVDVVYPPEDARLTSSMRVLFQALTIATYRLKESELAGADVVISPELPKTSGQLGFADRKVVTEAGAKAAEAKLTELRGLFPR